MLACASDPWAVELKCYQAPYSYLFFRRFVLDLAAGLASFFSVSSPGRFFIWRSSLKRGLGNYQTVCPANPMATLARAERWILHESLGFPSGKTMGKQTVLRLTEVKRQNFGCLYVLLRELNVPLMETWSTILFALTPVCKCSIKGALRAVARETP